jgi:hypothetical protein
MRCNTLSVLCLAIGAFALPTETLQPRDTTVILRSIKNVESALNHLSSAIRSISPRMPSEEVNRRWPDVERNCHMVSDTMYRDSREIRQSKDVNILEAPQLLGPLNNLETLTTKVVNDWISIKPAVNVRDRQNIQRVLQEHSAAAGEYADAILSKQPAIASPAGALMRSQVQSTIQRAISAYRS